MLMDVVAALIGFVSIRHQDRVGLTLFGDEPGLREAIDYLSELRGSETIVIEAGPSTSRSLYEPPVVIRAVPSLGASF